MRRVDGRCIACPEDAPRVKTSPPPCLLPPTAPKPSIDASYLYDRFLNRSPIPTCQRMCPPFANRTCQAPWRNAHGLPFTILTCQKLACNKILASGSSCGVACQHPFSFLNELPNWPTRVRDNKQPSLLNCTTVTTTDWEITI